MKVELDGRLMFDKASTHTYLQQQLALPAYYGRNLDALYDLLTERAQPIEIVLSYEAMMKHQLGRYAKALINTLRDAAENNPALTLTIEE